MSFQLDPLNLYLDYHFLNDEHKQIEELSNEEEKKDKEFNELLLLAKNTNIKKLKKNKEMLEYIRTRPSSSISNFRYSPPNDNFIEKELKNDKNHNIKFKELSTPLFTFATSIEDTPKSFVINQRNISPNYSRPLYPSPIRLKEISFNLNMTLPINELVDFIERFKRKYDHDNSIVKSIHELFNEEFEDTDTKLPSIKKNYADMFFCYDCKKLGLDEKIIKKEIEDYRYDLWKEKEKVKYKHIKLSTIKRYISIAKEYIDNQKYKQLVI